MNKASVNNASVSQEEKERPHIAIIGAGCAGLSLAAQLARQDKVSLSLFGPTDDRGDHVWGFWDMPFLSEAAKLSTAHWQKWQIRDTDSVITHSCTNHPYHALSSRRWLDHCTAQLEGIAHHKDMLAPDAPLPDAQIIADSRPEPPPPGVILQHFMGFEIQTDAAIFDPETAILMDFRTDQSHGLHFIYLLPFDETTALVESTYFTPDLLPASAYEADIATYLQRHFGLDTFTIVRREAGMIPMHVGTLRTPKSPIHRLIGGAGGAIRPSSGYAFAFIQKQISAMMQNSDLQSAPPHSRVDLWMDKIFLDVLRRNKQTAPRFFIAMAKALKGGEFARFMTGEASITVWLKVIFAMPKMPFFLSTLRLLFGR